VPHGINSEVFKPLPDDDPELFHMRKQLFPTDKLDQYKFILFFNSRNIQRKRVMNVVLAFRAFCDNLTPDEANQCALLLHTEPKFEAGTDLVACREAFGGPYMENIYFTSKKFAPEEMNLIYNVVDVTINIASSEGFGLATAEAIMCGTPCIISVTGGLQDQIGQVDDAGNPVEFSLNFGSNNEGKYKTHGIWCTALWPVTRCMQGSVPTPYIYDDLVKWEDATKAMLYWYLMPKDKREWCGLKGREWAMGDGGINAKNLCDQFTKGLNFVFDNWIPPENFDIFTEKDYIGHKMPNDCLGFEMPKFDKAELYAKIDQNLTTVK
jgi:hypothetical protein